MKLSVSISDDTAHALESVVGSVAGATTSLVTDVALRRLLSLPAAEIEKNITRQRLDRKATTRAGWAQSFWLVLGAELGRADTIDNPYAARHYGPFYIVLLLNHERRQDDEGDPFPIHLATQMWTESSPPPERWVFERAKSPVRAAEEVAAKLLALNVVRSET